MSRLAITLPLALIACTQGAECVDKGDCGDLQICERGRCKTVGCATSLDCGIEQYCDPQRNTCEAGCATSDDCLAGEDCNTASHECLAYECRTTALDCAVGQACNTSTGVCDNAMGNNCSPCSDPFYDYYGYAYGGTGCGSGLCVEFQDAANPWCVDPCSPSDANSCARGFDCTDLTGGGDYYCLAWCPAVMSEINGN